MNNFTSTTQDVKSQELNKINEFYIDTGKGTIRVTEHFVGTQTYDDVIKAAIRREFSS